MVSLAICIARIVHALQERELSGDRRASTLGLCRGGERKIEREVGEALLGLFIDHFIIISQQQ